MISPIDMISPISGNTAAQSVTPNDGTSLFTSVFQSAIDNVKATENEVAEAEYLLATGQLDNPSTLLIAETKSTIAVELLVQLRNKAMEAYNQISSINF